MFAVVFDSDGYPQKQSIDKEKNESKTKDIGGLALITDAQNTAIRKPASLLVAVAMLLALAAPAQAQDQDLPTVTVSKIADRITEGSSNLVFRIEINPAQSDPLLVHLETEQTGDWVTGTLDGEFNLTIPANRSTLDFGIPPIDDAIVEANGSLTLTVNSGVDYETGDANSVTIDVFDNDEPVTLSFADGEEVEVAENAGTVDVSVVVTVDDNQEDTEQFELSLQAAPGSSQVTIPPGPLRIVILDDEEPPPDTYYIEVGGNGRQIGTYAVSVMDTNDTGTIHRPQEDS